MGHEKRKSSVAILFRVLADLVYLTDERYAIEQPLIMWHMLEIALFVK